MAFHKSLSILQLFNALLASCADSEKFYATFYLELTSLAKTLIKENTNLGVTIVAHISVSTHVLLMNPVSCLGLPATSQNLGKLNLGLGGMRRQG